MSAVNGLTLGLGFGLVMALTAWVLLRLELRDERADHAATRYDLGAAWSAYDAVRAVHEEADLGIVELRMPPAVREHLLAAAVDRHPAGRALRVAGGGG